MLLSGSNLQQHISLLPVAKGSMVMFLCNIENMYIIWNFWLQTFETPASKNNNEIFRWHKCGTKLSMFKRSTDLTIVS